jgi:hypothetical protein
MRFLILIAVVLVHIAAFFLIAARHETREPPESSPLTSLTLLEPPRLPEHAESSAPATVKSRSAAHTQRVAPEVSPGTIFRLPEEPFDAHSEPAPVDWALEAELTAAQWAEEQSNSERKASDLARCHRPLFTEHAHASAFDWPHAQTHRMDTSSRGLFVFKLTERCSGFSWLGFLGIGCSLGKIEARGDLFLHMRGPVQYGDWMSVDPNPNAVVASCDALGTSPALR